MTKGGKKSSKDERKPNNMRKKITAILIAAVTALSAHGTSKAISLDNSILTDINDHWAESDILTLNRAGVLKGSANKANPDSDITRGEFAALVSRSLSLPSYESKIFNDVSEESVFFTDIGAAYSAGLITGMEDGNFYPDNLITREEIMLIISRCTSPAKSKTPLFTDINKRYKYLTELTTAVSTGIISGYSDGTFRPSSNATRAEAAAMTVRLLNSSGGTSKSKLNSFAKSYIKNDAENMQKNIELSTGTALNELYYRIDSAEAIMQNGVSLSKSIDNISQTSSENKGLISTLTYVADITYTLDSIPKRRTAVITLKIISKNNTLYVYDYNINFKYNQKINLTWEVYSAAPDYSPSGVNIVSPSSFHISAEDLQVESTYLADGISFFNALTTSYMNYADSNGYDVWAMYKTDFTLSTSNKFLNNASTRKKAVETLIKYACKYKIDGINFDFENMYISNRDMFTKHLREVTLAMHEMGLFVSADVTRKEVTSSVWSMCYDRNAIAETADYVMLMAYDEYYAGSKTAGSVASLGWTEDTIKKTLSEVPAQKLVLGIPFYMRYWEIKNGTVTFSKAISMETGWNLISANNATYTWMEKDGQYMVSWQNGKTTCAFWLENDDTVKKRIELVNNYSLAGTASWRRGLETSNIWDVISKNLFR